MGKDPLAVQYGRLGAYISHSRHDGRAITAAARAKAAARFLDQARAEAEERGEKLTEEELERRARMLRKAFAVRMALKSAVTRQAKKKRSKKAA
jgi:predicted Zn-dependent peptidase